MSTAAYDYWLLDLDGTLVDVEWPYVRWVFDELEGQLGRSFTDEQARRLWYGLNGARDEHLASLGIDRDRFWHAFDDIEDPENRAAASYLHRDAELFEGRSEPVGIVTHCRPRLTKAVLDHLDIRDWFDVVICCNDTLGWKPDPAPVRRAINQLGVGPETGILIGDSPSDVGAAWNAGLDGAHIERHGPERRGYCVLADYQATSLGQIVAFADSPRAASD